MAAISLVVVIAVLPVVPIVSSPPLAYLTLILIFA